LIAPKRISIEGIPLSRNGTSKAEITMAAAVVCCLLTKELDGKFGDRICGFISFGHRNREDRTDAQPGKDNSCKHDLASRDCRGE
jgi:hypothetical protein